MAPGHLSEKILLAVICARRSIGVDVGTLGLTYYCGKTPLDLRNMLNSNDIQLSMESPLYQFCRCPSRSANAVMFLQYCQFPLISREYKNTGLIWWMHPMKKAVDSWAEGDTYRISKSYMYQEGKCQKSTIRRGSRILSRAAG